MVKISIDNDAIRGQFGTYANYARQRGLDVQQLSLTKSFMRENNPCLQAMLKDGFVKVKGVKEEVKEEEIA